jgi:hypothetical protein
MASWRRVGRTWTRGQWLTLAIGTVASGALWVSTKKAHDTGEDYISNLAWTGAAAATLGTVILAGIFLVIRVVRMLYQRQEELAGAIIKQNEQDAKDAEHRHAVFAAGMLAEQRRLAAEMIDRQRKVLDGMVETWNNHGKRLDEVYRKVSDSTEDQRDLLRNMGELGRLVSERENAAEDRYAKFTANGADLRKAMDALAKKLPEPSPKVRELKRRTDEE